MSQAKPEFDTFAEEYDRALAEGISVSGEDKNFFAEGRAQWLQGKLKALRATPGSILDFGCGTGSSTPFLLKLEGAEHLHGVDVSKKSIEVAQRTFGSKQASFSTLEGYVPDGSIELAFCNGVFHHIPLQERAGAVDYVFKSLRPGGLFAFWENNPWNPGTRYVMSRIPFDRDASTLTPPEARTLLGKGGFEILETNFLFIFPKLLAWLRKFEPWVAGWPLGAQYLVLCQKPREKGD